MKKVQERLFISGKPLGPEADEDQNLVPLGHEGCVNKLQSFKHPRGKRRRKKREKIPK